MKAAIWEFRYRFFVISLVYAAAFGIYAIDHTNSVEVLLKLLARHFGPGWSSAAAFHVVFGLGAFLVLLACLIRSWATAYLTTSVVHDRDLHVSRLVAAGPYRHVRNPLYLGNILMAIGFAPMASLTGAAIVVLGNCIVISRLIGREESELLATQGASFRAYLTAVPRLLPSLRPRVPASGAQPAWLQGVAGEGMMWAFFVALALFAATFSFPAFGCTMVIGLVLSILINRFAWRKSSARATSAG